MSQEVSKIVDVIIPVYKGCMETRACINSVLRYPQENDFHVIILNDDSPDPAISEYLDGLVAKRNQHQPSLTLLKNDHNLGFVATVNRGIRQNPQHDVLLLNSDTIVANNWLDRLYACAYRHKNIATVSPFSNNATICSFPKPNCTNELPKGWSVAALDRLFSETVPGQFVPVFTTVGFCMFIKRRAIEDLGHFPGGTTGCFDESLFGKGYGEENDFCMRAAARGWQHALCADTFVYHKGALSFEGSETRRRQQAVCKVEKRHPGFHQKIWLFNRDDPVRPIRMQVKLELVRRSPRPKVLFVSHSLGGGVEKHICDLMGLLPIDVLVARPDRRGGITLSVGSDSLRTAGRNDVSNEAERLFFPFPDAYPEFLQTCRYLGVSRIHFHHLQGFPGAVTGLPKDLGLPYDITLHDFWLIAENPTLTDQTGSFDRRLVKNNSKYLVFLKNADRLIAPSESTRILFAESYGDFGILVAPHPEKKDCQEVWPPVFAKKISKNECMRIVVIGALGREKGADLLNDCVKAAHRRKLPFKFHLIGYAHRPLHRSLVLHGPYLETELEGRLREVDPHVVWFPAKCPETFSYTLSVVLRNGMPALLPNIGAFPERVTGRPYTWTTEWNSSVQPILKEFFTIRETLIKLPEGVAAPWPLASQRVESHFLCPDFYPGVYLAPLQKKRVSPMDGQLTFSPRDFVDKSVPRDASEKLLAILLSLKSSPVIGLLTQLIPYRLQRRIKRKLSGRPVHTIIQ